MKVRWVASSSREATVLPVVKADNASLTCRDNNKNKSMGGEI